MSLTFNTKTYAADSFSTNQVIYYGAAKTMTLKDTLSLTRTEPKPTADFSGISRTSAKLVRTVALTGAKTTSGDLIVEILVRVPVGAASADVDAILNDTGAFLSAASFKTHVKVPQVSF